ncbi:unnamed protein product [Chilo suppressalis]|uniref:Ionotropic glutamate receptor C-terminal domain-containing protein n=1 Tax=Chilo suppressalis TaxID=168631 RepID=A0ABN8LE89_CHISP|nr:unnamed protein product [Chilo suppressalis]
MNTAYFDWVIAVHTVEDYNKLYSIFNETAIRFDQNIIVAYPNFRRNVNNGPGLCDNNFSYNTKLYFDSVEQSNVFNEKDNRCRKYRSCSKSIYERNYYKASNRFRNLTKNNIYKNSGNIIKLFQAGILQHNYTRLFEMMNASNFSLRNQFYRWRQEHRISRDHGGVHIVQYFQARPNTTLYAYYLGYWTLEQSMSGVHTPYPVDVRNFLGEELVVGRCNFTEDGTPSLDNEGPSAPALLDDVLNFLTAKLNATSVNRYYSKLGFRTYEGTWTGLLGALLAQSVDVALEPVTAHPARHQDMDFIFPIAETMCNIYIRQQETSTVRDIFMAPFSVRLLACVMAIAFFASSAVILINRLAPTVKAGSRPMEYTEALIWSTGILCQQGGSWTPPNPAASILLIVCLLFAVVTYNSYAAFITSVLSVRVASLDTVAAVLHSPDFKIGYIRNGADQMYLMSTKDAQLNAFYIRGYSDAENLVATAEEGLARAAKQNYAFFTGQRVARTTLRSLSQARGRCAVRELPVYSTRAQLAFPLPRRSPYARPILISLLQLHDTGALARLQTALVPAMPECAPPVGFASARAADVSSALILIVAGLSAASIIGLAEYAWKNRMALQHFMLCLWRRIIRLVQLEDCFNME